MEKPCNTPEKKYLLECFIYRPEAGDLTWRERPSSHFNKQSICKSWNKKYAHRKITSTSLKGYIRLGLNGTHYFAHRIIFKMVTGVDADFIDHINGKVNDNRFNNLRSVTSLTNAKNAKNRRDSKSNLTGVVWIPSIGSWRARITSNSRRISLGNHSSLLDAACARKSAELKFGFHPNHGRA